MKIIEQHIKNNFGNNISVVEKKTISGGSINKATMLVLSSGEKIFLKQNSSKMKKMFETETMGLKALDVENGPRVPRPICFYEGEKEQFLLMEYIDPGTRHADYFKQFGVCLAYLHKTHSAKQWGLPYNNYIGSTAQINTQTKSWVEFFRDQRLGFQLNLAVKNNLADHSLSRQIEKIMQNLHNYLPEPEEGPTLLHGDLWAGNASTGPNGEPVIFDPAVYFGHREADLAMTELFGRFDQDFYDAYNYTWPVNSDYESRRDLYNLYHMLNHLNLFGSGYKNSIQSIVKQYT